MEDSHTVDEEKMAGPLEGLRVVEMGQLIAGPFCGQIMADFGADVVKIEEPISGDPMRQWGIVTEGASDSIWWAVIARNKKSVALDLRTEEGQTVAKRLIAEADILIENFRPGTLERWGISSASLRELNPKLIVVRVSGFGQSGPYAARPGYGSIGEAMGGLRHVVGDPSLPPSRVGISIGDSAAALFATIGALSALHSRAQSGRGQEIDCSIFESVLALMESLVPDFQLGGYQRERSGSILPGIAPSNLYQTKDGHFLVIAANQGTVFSRLASAMHQPELVEDPRFATHQARGVHQSELDEIVQRFTSGYSAQELEALLVASEVPVGRVYTVQDMLTDAHFLARNSIIDVEHAELGTMTISNIVPRLSDTPGQVKWLGPRLGEHTAEVLTELGMNQEQILDLQSRGVVT